MFKRLKRVLYYFSVVSILFVSLVAFCFVYRQCKLSTSIESIKGGEYLGNAISPGGKYEAKAYLNDSGATTDFAVLVVLITRESGEQKNIFWQYHSESAKMNWISDSEIVINGIHLNVPNEIYDYRKNNK